MSIDDIQILVVTAVDGGATPVQPPGAVRFDARTVDPARFTASQAHRALLAGFGSDPVYRAVPYREWLNGAAPDPAVVFGQVSPSWNECLDDPDWGWDPERLNAPRFGPGFSDDERLEAAKLVENDDAFGGGLSMFRFKHLYDAYPLRSGAVAVRVSGPDDVDMVKRYADLVEFFADHGCARLGNDDAEWFAAHVENEARGWDHPAYPPLHDDPENGYGL